MVVPVVGLEGKKAMGELLEQQATCTKIIGSEDREKVRALVKL